MKRKLSYLVIVFLISAFILTTASLASAHNLLLSKSASKLSQPKLDNTLDLCMNNEPGSLYIYSQDQSIWQAQILSAVFDGPMDSRSYSHQPVIFDSVPNFQNGQLITETVTVNQGDLIVDASGGSVVSLEPGTDYFPPGCYASSCATTYNGGQVEMEHLVITHTLLSNLTWSDTHPLTSDDMLYSFNLLADPATPGNKYYVERTSSFITTTLTQTMWTGLPGFFTFDFASIYWTPLPEHVWSAYTPTELITATVSSRTPLGWGAYVIDDWTGGHISMHKNPLYFRAGEGLPHFDNLIVHFGSELSGMLDGTCDVVVSASDDLGLLLRYDDLGLLEVVSTPGTVWEHMDFGIQSSSVYTGFAALTGAFEDVRVRKAFAYCIDRQLIADTAFSGMGIVPNAYIPDDHPYYPPDATTYPYDPVEGRALLDAAGWVDSNGNGIRNKGSIEFMLTLKTTTAQLRYTVASMIAEQMLDCGIQVTPIHMYAGDLFANWPNGPVFGRKFDLSEFSWLTGFRPPCELFGSWEIPTDAYPYGSNDPGFSYPTYDTACLQAMGSLTEAERQAYHEEAVRIFTQELPVLPLFTRLKWGMNAPHITGFSLDPSENTFWNIEELSTGIRGIIPPGGGSLISPEDNTAYSFSPGTFSDTVVFTHTPLSPVLVPGFGDLLGAGHFFSQEATLDGQWIQPSQPYTMTIGYTDSEHALVIENSLGLYYWYGDKWVKEPGAVLDTSNNTIVVTPDHFGHWAVLGEPFKHIFIPVINR